MTVTKDTSLLRSFKSKIDEAVNCVPKMCATDKLKAVQFWNVISEKLQDIINSCAADINAIAVKTQENDSEKMPSEISSRPVSGIPNCSISSDFINLPSNYGMCHGIAEQYHTVDIGNAHLLTSETAFSIVTEATMNSNNVSNIPHIHHLNSTMNSCGRNISDNYVSIESLSQNSCDTLGIDSCVSTGSRTLESIPEESDKNNDCSSKEIIHQDTHQISEDTEEISSSCQNSNVRVVSSHELVTKDNKTPCKTVKRSNSKKSSILRNSLLRGRKLRKFKSEPKCDKRNHVSDISENSEDSIKSDFDTTIQSEESDSNHAEPIVSFVVSSSEEILAKNGLTPELVEKYPANDYTMNNKHSLKSYTCSDCSAKFATRGNLIVHIRRHTGEKPYSCSKCTARFTTKGNLKRHLKTHTGEKPYACSHCEGKFTEKKSLIVHMRRHTGERPYECKECGKRFAQSGILQTHMAMHLNQKIHLCEHCGKSFRQRSQLQTHKLRHENVRKYGCSACSARFLTKGDLERHIRTHTGERPYVCDVCSKAFTRQQSLNEHLNRHYGIRPYVCKYCSRTFTEMSACYKHIKQHEKAAAAGSEISPTESSTQSSKLEDSNQTGSKGNSCEIVRLTRCDSPKPENNELSEDNDENDQSLAELFENYC